ncbi:hypothetical protein IU433_00750 [Nocardia puris]|uniref:Uncharacterized protein n=1 Tax=Nocardia puris TaxID=208602 RepID=A0A366DWS2_9NOCA|nr:hypothetical protein [Nocardia puris]MBF6210312.1 hypothetical protein [Nocardia puris]MBF6367387.1 hypothetical protein [Nocardia puris]MBF6457572.1 hypothetical protein [Nocardia puris]RBO93734.1 hypothetical protein DFR74_102151 [Nocardia puris]
MGDVPNDGGEPGAAPRGPWLELARGREVITARRLPDGMYQVEHRRCEGDRLEFYTTDHCLVRDVLCGWLDDAEGWRAGVVWAPVDPDIAELERMRGELSGMLGGLSLLDDLGASMDQALARADDLLAGFDEDPLAR